MAQKAMWAGLASVLVLAGLAANSFGQVALSTPEQITTGDEAKEIKKQYDEDALTWYAVYTNNKAIYINLAIKDSLQKSKVMQNGIELWIDSKGRKNKTTGIMFPLGSKAAMYPGGGNRLAAGGTPSFFKNDEHNNTRNADSALALSMNGQKELELKGFENIPDGRQPLVPVTGFTVTIQMLHDTLVYNAVIPLSVLAMPQMAKGSISIGILEKGMPIPGLRGDMDGPGGEMDGPPPGDGGMMLPPPGDMPPGEVDMRRLFETNSIWCKLKMHI